MELTENEINLLSLEQEMSRREHERQQLWNQFLYDQLQNGKDEVQDEGSEWIQQLEKEVTVNPVRVPVRMPPHLIQEWINNISLEKTSDDNCPSESIGEENTSTDDEDSSERDSDSESDSDAPKQSKDTSPTSAKIIDKPARPSITSNMKQNLDSATAPDNTGRLPSSGDSKENQSQPFRSKGSARYKLYQDSESIVDISDAQIAEEVQPRKRLAEKNLVDNVISKKRCLEGLEKPTGDKANKDDEATFGKLKKFPDKSKQIIDDVSSKKHPVFDGNHIIGKQGVTKSGASVNDKTNQKVDSDTQKSQEKLNHDSEQDLRTNHQQSLQVKNRGTNKNEDANRNGVSRSDEEVKKKGDRDSCKHLGLCGLPYIECSEKYAMTKLVLVVSDSDSDSIEVPKVKKSNKNNLPRKKSTAKVKRRSKNIKQKRKE